MIYLYCTEASPDHPRLRGENLIGFVGLKTEQGSPPLARGKLTHRYASSRSSRITPACAGKTISVKSTKRLTRDHPRLRGENVLLSAHLCQLSGSPPLARGKLTTLPKPFGSRRITPACAGKTGLCPEDLHSERDHPRLRGENSVRQHHASITEGSPPLARGKH